MQQKGVFTVDEAAGAFKTEFLDAEKVRAWLFRKINPDGPRCPECGAGVLPGRASDTFWAGGRVCCKGCGKYFTASTGTMIAGAALEEREIFLLAVLLGFEVQVAEIAEILGRSEETVRFWRGKFELAEAGRIADPSLPGSGDSIPPGERGRPREGVGDVSIIPPGFKIRVCPGLPEGSALMVSGARAGGVLDAVGLRTGGNNGR